MMYEFKLADLGEGMHEAEIVQWLINVGDTTKLDQAIAKVETDKAVVDLPSPVAGRVSEIRFKDGETAKVGDVLVVFQTSAKDESDGASKQAEISAANSFYLTKHSAVYPETACPGCTRRTKTGF